MEEEREIELIGDTTYNQTFRNLSGTLNEGSNQQFNLFPFHQTQQKKLNFFSFIWFHEIQLNWMELNEWNIITVLYRSPVNLRQVY